jgi:hypothetical protein
MSRKKRKPMLSVTLFPSERATLKALYLRFVSGHADDGDLFESFAREDLEPLVDKGLVEVDEQNRWFLTSDGVYFAEMVASETSPFEKAVIKPGSSPEHN